MAILPTAVHCDTLQKCPSAIYISHPRHRFSLHLKNYKLLYMKRLCWVSRSKDKPLGSSKTYVNTSNVIYFFLLYMYNLGFDNFVIVTGDSPVTTKAT